MRFMMMIKATRNSEAGMPPSPELMAAIGKFTEEGIRAGVVLDTGGLLPSAMGARLRIAGGQVTVTDGPFPETKELIGGFAVLRLPSKEEAVEVGRRFMEVHAEILGPSYEGEMEIRPMFDGPDGCAALKDRALRAVGA